MVRDRQSEDGGAGPSGGSSSSSSGSSSSRPDSRASSRAGSRTGSGLGCKRTLDEDADGAGQGGGEGTEGEEASLKRQLTMGPPHTVTLLLPTDAVRLLVDPHSSLLARIAEESTANILVQLADDLPYASRERCLIVTGALEAIAHAEMLILEKLRDRRPDEDSMPLGGGRVMTRWVLPNALCQMLGTSQDAAPLSSSSSVSSSATESATATSALAVALGQQQPPRQRSSSRASNASDSSTHSGPPGRARNRASDTSNSSRSSTANVEEEQRRSNMMQKALAAIAQQCPNVRVQLAHEHEVLTATNERVIYMVGESQQCNQACDILRAHVGGRSFAEARSPASSDDPGQARAHTFIPARATGFLLGKGGSAMKRLCGDTNCRIQIASLGEMDMGCTLVHVNVIGDDADAVARATALVDERANEWKRRQPQDPAMEPEASVKIAVPAALVGHLIGKGGAFVQSVNEATGAAMKILQDARSPSLSVEQRPIVLTGTTSQILHAQELLVQRIEDAPSAKLDTNSSSSSSTMGIMDARGRDTQQSRGGGGGRMTTRSRSRSASHGEASSIVSEADSMAGGTSMFSSSGSTGTASSTDTSPVFSSLPSSTISTLSAASAPPGETLAQLMLPSACDLLPGASVAPLSAASSTSTASVSSSASVMTLGTRARLMEPDGVTIAVAKSGMMGSSGTSGFGPPSSMSSLSANSGTGSSMPSHMSRGTCPLSTTSTDSSFAFPSSASTSSSVSTAVTASTAPFSTLMETGSSTTTAAATAAAAAAAAAAGGAGVGKATLSISSGSGSGPSGAAPPAGSATQHVSSSFASYQPLQQRHPQQQPPPQKMNVGGQYGGFPAPPPHQVRFSAQGGSSGVLDNHVGQQQQQQQQQQHLSVHGYPQHHAQQQHQHHHQPHHAQQFQQQHGAWQQQHHRQHQHPHQQQQQQQPQFAGAPPGVVYQYNTGPYGA